jgi:AcrR family transcriptional regulator
LVSAYTDDVPPRDRTKRRALPRQARATASVDAILEAAARVLAKHGFAKTTTNRIAEVAGVNVSLVYRYFAGKEAIVGELVDRAAAQTLAVVRSALVAHARSPLPIALRAVLDEAVDTPGVPALHRELVEHVDITKRRERVDELRGAVGTLFAKFLAARRKELRRLPDPEATMFVLKHVVEAASHAVAFYRPRALDRERAIGALHDIVLRALVP